MQSSYNQHRYFWEEHRHRSKVGNWKYRYFLGLRKCLLSWYFWVGWKRECKEQKVIVLVWVTPSCEQHDVTRKDRQLKLTYQNCPLGKRLKFTILKENKDGFAWVIFFLKINYANTEIVFPSSALLISANKENKDGFAWVIFFMSIQKLSLLAL